MSSLSIGIVGLPNVGKSTLFNALTCQAVPAENYPFCTIDPTVGIVPVPDDRLDRLSKMSQSAKTVPAVVEFVDIAGLIAGASKGEGLGNKFLANIRETQAIAQVVRVFDDGQVMHVSGQVDPKRDIEVINMELILADLETVSHRLESLVKSAGRGDKEALAEKETLEKVKPELETGKPLFSLVLTDEDLVVIKRLGLLSIKPVVYVLNQKEGQSVPGDIISYIENELKADWISMDIKTEAEISSLDPEEQKDFRQETGEAQTGLARLAEAAYVKLGLMTYFTTGPTESRGWTVKQGSTAPEAGAAIHSDFQDKFIKAEVINWEKLLEYGSKAAAREKGLVRLEGKDYIVKDGDVIEFKI